MYIYRERESQSYIKVRAYDDRHGLFCKEVLCFNTMPYRHMPLLVHFRDRKAEGAKNGASLRGNHLSNTTCLTRAFFKSGEYCSEIN